MNVAQILQGFSYKELQGMFYHITKFYHIWIIYSGIYSSF